MSEHIPDPDGAIPPGPPEPAYEPEPATEEQDIQYVQKVRKQIVHATFKNGSLPEDRVALGALMQALDGLDRSAIARTRIKSDSENSKGMAGSAAAIAQMLMNMGKRQAEDDFPVEPPMLPADIAPVIDKAELVTGTHPVSTAPFTLPPDQSA